jgi:cyanate lyase
MPASRPPRATPTSDERPYHLGNLRRTLLEEGWAATVESGGKDISLREIARRAGVSPTASFHHFRNKEALLVAVAVEGFERLTATLHKRVESLDDPTERLRIVLRTYIEFAIEHPAVFFRMFGPLLSRDDRREIGTVIAPIRGSNLHRRRAMTRDNVTRKILAAKRAKSLSWKTIVAEIGGGSAVYLTAALMGQMKLRAEQAERAAKLLDLGEEETSLLQEIPNRGSLPTAVPTDPLIYRFYELVQVYGTTWKELVQEEFGDGIMSAIDFDMSIERQPDPKGDRVKLTLSGKFLPYKEY